jgi:anti-anti-sigma factor
MVSQLPIRVHVENEEVIIVAPMGEIDALTSPDLHRLIAELLSYEPPDVVVDLSRVSFADCAGLRVLVHAARQLDSYGGRLTIRGATDIQRMILQQIRGTQVVRLAP